MTSGVVEETGVSSSESVNGPVALDEPVSPELVLVSPGLRILAVEALWAASRRQMPNADDASAETSAIPLSGPRIAKPVLVYAGWQLCMGALFALGMFVVVAGLVALASFLS
jgi:hypothetical protein